MRPPGATRSAPQFPGDRLVIPAGGFKVRSNDTDYVFRPHSAFAHLTGFGSDQEPDAVLVLEPLPDGGHDAVLYFKPWGGRDSDEFFGDTRYGEFWVGGRPTLEDIEAEFGLTARSIDEFADAVAKDAGEVDRAGGARRRPRRDGAGRAGPRRLVGRGRGRRGGPERRRGRRRAVPVPLHAATGQGRVGDRADAARRRRDPGGVRGGHRAAARRGRQGPRRAVGRGRLRPPRPPPGQRRRVRLDLRQRGPRHHAALDQEHRGPRGRRAAAPRRRASRSTRCSPPTSPARCRSTGRSPRPSAGSTTRCTRRSRRPWRRSSRASSSARSTTPPSG